MAGIFILGKHIYESEVMNIGEHTKRNPDRFIGKIESSWLGVGVCLFQGGGLGALCGGDSGIPSRSCVLDRGGLSA